MLGPELDLQKDLGVPDAQDLRNRLAIRLREVAVLRKLLPIAERAERTLGPGAPMVRIR